MEIQSLIEGITTDIVYEYRGEQVLHYTIKLLGKKKIRHNLMNQQFAADLFYTFYLPYPRLRRNIPEPYIEQYSILQAMLREPAIWKVKPLTVADKTISTIAASVFLERLIRELSMPRKSSRERSTSEKEKLKEAVSRAMMDTSKIARNASNIKQLLAKTGAGRASTLQFENVLEEILELARNTDIAKILELLRSIEVSKISTRRTVRASRGWITSLEIGGDLERVHPSRLAFPEILFLVELVNSRLLLYRKELPGSHGSIYVLLDKSGSMSGTKMDWARAVALALFIKSRGQGRNFYARFFDSIVYDRINIPYTMYQRKAIDLIKYLGTVKAGGGTDIVKALATASSDLISSSVKGVSDVVLITDGEDTLSKLILKGIISRGGFRLHTVMIQGDNPVLREVSHSYMIAEKLDEKEVLRVVMF